MTFHSQDGLHFLGLRRTAAGQIEIVYDAQAGKRMVFGVTNATLCTDWLASAMQSALTQRDVLTGLSQALAKHQITLELRD